jgi:chromosome segregation ATPase
MNEIQTTVIDTLTIEILILKQQTAQNIIEIGKRLIAAKESLPHGEWGKYLDEKVDFSETSAKRFMRVAREFSNSPALVDLGSSKLFALLDVPSEEREEFVQVNSVDEMTTRELQKAIKERDEALKTLDTAKRIAIEKSEEAKKSYDEKCSAESKVRTVDAVLRETQKDVENLQNALRKQKEKSAADIAELQSFIGEAKASGNDEEVSRLQASLQEIQNDLDGSAHKIDELEEQLKAKPIDVITAEPVIIEKVPEETLRELEELRNKAGQNNTQPVIKFKIYFEALQKTFRDELEVMAEIKEDYPETYEKCKNAISDLISKMAERL